MTASLVWRAENPVAELTDIAFILAGNRLVTIRYAEPRAFALFSTALLRMPGKYRTGAELMSRPARNHRRPHGGSSRNGCRAAR